MVYRFPKYFRYLSSDLCDRESGRERPRRTDHPSDTTGPVRVKSDRRRGGYVGEEAVRRGDEDYGEGRGRWVGGPVELRYGSS